MNTTPMLSPILAPIRVGVIGAGANTRKKHIPGLMAQPDVEIIAVANRTPESSARAAAEFDIPRACKSWQEIITNPDIDAVCIGTWPYMHATLTCAALNAGKHVLVEARMASNRKEAKAMLLASQQNPGLIAQIVPSPITLAFDRTIKELIGKGFIGDLIAVDARLAPGSTFPNPDSPVHWRQDRTFSGNNIMAMGIWYEGIIRWTGPTTSVQSLGQTVVKYRKNKSGERVAMTIPDYIDVLSDFAQGGQLHLSMSNVTGHAPAADVYVFGTEGTLRLVTNDSAELTLWAGSRDDVSLKAVEIPEAKRGSWRVEEEFIRCIRGEERVSHTDFATGVHYMDWTDAVTTSWKTGKRIPLDLAH